MSLYKVISIRAMFVFDQFIYILLTGSSNRFPNPKVWILSPNPNSSKGKITTITMWSPETNIVSPLVPDDPWWAKFNVGYNPHWFNCSKWNCWKTINKHNLRINLWFLSIFGQNLLYVFGKLESSDILFFELRTDVVKNSWKLRIRNWLLDLVSHTG